MKKVVEISDQVAAFVRTQAPVPRQALRAALRALAQEQGDIKPLEGPLLNYWRLRVRGYRIIFAYGSDGRSIRCIFAERRSVVYDVMEELVRARLFDDPRKPTA